MTWNLVSTAAAWANPTSQGSPWSPFAGDEIDADEGQIVMITLLGRNSGIGPPTFALDKPVGETNDWVWLERIIGGSTSNTAAAGSRFGIKVAKPGGWSGFSPTVTITGQLSPPSQLLANWSVWEGGSLLPRWIQGHGLTFPPQWIPANNALPTETNISATLSTYYQPRSTRTGPPQTIGADLTIGFASNRASIVPTQDPDTTNGPWADVGNAAGGVTGGVGGEIAAREAYKIPTAAGDQTLDMVNANKAVLLALCSAESITPVQQRGAFSAAIGPRFQLDTTGGPNVGPGLNVGDIILAMAACKAPSASLTDPAGYTFDRSKVSGVDSVQSTFMKTYHRTADGTEPNTTDITMNPASGPGVGNVCRIRAADPDVPISIQSTIAAGVIASPLTCDQSVDLRPGDIVVWMSSSFRGHNAPTFTLPGITFRQYALTAIGTNAGTDIRTEVGFLEVDSGSGTITPQITLVSGSGSTQATVGLWVVRALFGPQPPIALAITDETSDSLTFEWSFGGGPAIDDYEVRIDGGAEVNVGTDTDHQFTGLAPNTTYTLEVRACNADGCSDWAAIEGTTCPDTPVNLTAPEDNITSGEFDLCWDAPPGGADFYEVRINTGPEVEGTSCHTFTDLDSSTTYTASVRACNDTCCSDWATLDVTTAAPPAFWSTCPCGPQWFVDACDLTTGRVRAILEPVAMEFQEILNRAGTGSLTFPIHGVRVRDIWPHLTSVYISRVPDAGGDPVGLWAGIVEAVDARGGTARVGLKSIDSYLHRRRISTDLTYSNVQQTQIGVSLVAQAIPDGIPLTGQAEASAFIKSRTYLGSTERQFLGPLIEELTDSEDGPDYTLLHTKTGGFWSTRVLFQDEAGSTHLEPLLGDVAGNIDYGLVLDAQDHATLADAVGDGVIETAMLIGSPYPRFDTVNTYSGVTETTTLQQQATGWVNLHGDPYATPLFSIAGGDPDPSDLRLGDTRTFRFSQGVATFDGPARVTGITWSLAADAPETRVLALTPSNAIESVLNVTPVDPCPDC